MIKIDNKSVLIIINEVFPFENGETFVESEVKYYDQFDKVVFFPCSVSNYQERRRVDGDIDVVTPPVPNHRVRKLVKAFRYIRSLFLTVTLQEMVRLIQLKKLNLSKVKSLLSFVSVGEANYDFIRKYIERNLQDYDRVVFYSYWMHFHAYCAVRLKKFFRGKNKYVSSVSRCHSFDLYEYRNDNNYLPLRRLIIESLDMIFAISEDGRRYIEKKYEGMQKNVIVSRLGTLDHGIRKTRLDEGTLKIVSCSAVSSVKRVDRIVDGLALIPERKIHWVHFGGGALLDEVKQRAGERLPCNITFEFKGTTRNSEVLDYYATEDCHLFLNVSESEGIPVSIMEAISFGIPVIATNVGGVGEIVRDGYNGYLLDKDYDDSTLADGVKRIIDLRDKEYQYLRENARKMWELNYNADGNYANFSDLVIKLDLKQGSVLGRTQICLGKDKL